ncbi:Transcription factor 25 [Borealophlyctis nickersoniae]|nr:Transcription factor 25 [Borealophlyctis nickersoniae]
MTSRAYRKLIRQRGDIGDPLSVAQKGDPSDQSDDDAAEEVAAIGKPNLFDLLNAGEDGEALPSDSDHDEAPVAETLESAPKEHPSPTPPSKKSKKKKKKAGKDSSSGKGKKPAASPDENDADEIERTLKELNEKFGDLGNASASQQEGDGSSAAYGGKPLLGVDGKMLDADAEMKRMFGSRVVDEEIKRKNYVRMPKKPLLATPRDTWPRMSKTGLSMDLFDSKDGISYFTFVHSKSYQEIQKRFLDCISTHDPNTISHLQHMYPYHIDSLSQLSEICKHSNEIAMAAELIERALFAFERAFHSMFNLATGKCRLPYLRFENRAMHLVVFRHIGYVARRGCWRTSFEFTKLLLSLDPDNDPLGALLMIDHYALRAKELRWLRRLWEEWGEEKRLDMLPNMAYSIALAEWELENEEGKDHARSSRMLQKAIAYFPSVVLAIYEKCAASDPAVAGSGFFTLGGTESENALKLLLDLYVERNHPLWKVPEVLSWLRENVGSVVGRSQKKDAEISEGELLFRNISSICVYPYKATLARLPDFPSLTGALPPDVTALGVHMHDPIPPDNAPPSPYEEYERSRAASSNPFSDMGFLRGLLQSLLPWMNLNPAVRAAEAAGGGAEGEQAAMEAGAPGQAGGQELPQEVVGEEHLEATIRAAQAALPGLFPPPTEDNPNPEWIQALRTTIGRLGGWNEGGDAGDVGDGDDVDDGEGHNEEIGDEARNE